MESKQKGEHIANILTQLFKTSPLPNELKTQKKRWKDGSLGEKAKIRIVEKYTDFKCKIMCYTDTQQETPEANTPQVLENEKEYKYKVISYIYDEGHTVENTSQQKEERDKEDLI